VGLAYSLLRLHRSPQANPDHNDYQLFSAKKCLAMQNKDIFRIEHNGQGGQA
jgi:hypothetical protein